MNRVKVLTCIILATLFCILHISFQKSRYDLITRHELQEIQKKLKLIQPNERKDLAYFFEYANVFDQYAYTLVGYKPMSICCYLEDSEDLPQVFRADYRKKTHRNFANRLARGVQAWEKNKHLFHQEKFLIVHSHSSISKGMKQLTLLHKQLCRQILSDCSDIFSSELAKTISLDEIFEGLSNPLHSQFHEIRENDLLLGTLLGFGANNAQLFKERQCTGLKGFSNEWPVWPRKWLLPGFLCDLTTSETKELKLKYKEARRYIRWTYFNRNDLEVTLALLTRSALKI